MSRNDAVMCNDDSDMREVITNKLRDVITKYLELSFYCAAVFFTLKNRKITISATKLKRQSKCPYQLTLKHAVTYSQ